MAKMAKTTAKSTAARKAQSAKSSRRPSSGRLRSILTVLFSAAALLMVGVGGYFAFRSPLFLIRIVEIADQPENAPVDAQTISKLANIPLGKKSLFELDLKEVEKRILTHTWIREVHLQKRFPQTLTISVDYREPQALIQLDNGQMGYVDSNGKVFGQVNLMVQPDLPILSGFNKAQAARIPDALKVIEAWKRAQLGSVSEISSLFWDDERGFRALVVYPMSKQAKGRAWVELGWEAHQDFDVQLTRLGSVFRYLGEHGLAARQIWADTGKKIVVKFARGS